MKPRGPFILASTHAVAEILARHLGLARGQWHFLFDPDQTRGLKVVHVIIETDTAAKNPRHLDIMGSLNYHRHTERLAELHLSLDRLTGRDTR